jgi:cytochrome c551/c552
LENVRTSLPWLVAASLVLGGAARDRQQAIALSAESSGLVRTYCVSCHNDKLKTAGLSLQTLDLTDVPAHAEVSEKVARKLRSGEMPPSTVR